MTASDIWATLTRRQRDVLRLMAWSGTGRLVWDGFSARFRLPGGRWACSARTVQALTDAKVVAAVDLWCSEITDLGREAVKAGALK